MKRLFLVFSLIFIFVVIGCSNISEPKISEDEVKSIVLKEHTGDIGNVKVISVTHKGNEYIVKWENQDNCESGTDYINDQNGKIKKGETTIC